MNVRWLWLDHIPPELGLTKAQKRQVTKRVAESPTLTGWRAAVLVVMMAVMVAAFALFRLTLSATVVPGFVNAASFLSAPLLWISIALLRRFESRPHVRQALLELGYRTCRKCGYWLHGVADEAAKCPECGEMNLDRARKLNMRDLGELEIVTTMQQLGYEVCFHCGLLTLGATENSPKCPECGAARPALPRSSTEKLA